MPRVTGSPSGAYTVDFSYKELCAWTKHKRYPKFKCKMRISFDEDGEQTFVTEQNGCLRGIEELANDARACANYTHATARGWIADPQNPFYERQLTTHDAPVVKRAKSVDHSKCLRDAFLAAIEAEGEKRADLSRWSLMLLDARINNARVVYQKILSESPVDAVKTHYDWVRTIQRGLQWETVGVSAISMLTRVRKEHIAAMQRTYGKVATDTTTASGPLSWKAGGWR